MPYQTRPAELQHPPIAPVREDILKQIEEASQAFSGVATATAESTVSPQRVSTSVSTLTNTLLPFQWYLNSSAMRPDADERTDVYALEAWEKSDRGENVTVAVIDSLMQLSNPARLTDIAPASTVRPAVLTGEGELLDSDDLKLDDGTPMDYFVFEGAAGDRVTITAESADFNTVIGLFSAIGEDLELIAGNDNASEDTTHSRIEATLPATGTYAIFLTAADGGRGAYQITLDGIEGS